MGVWGLIQIVFDIFLMLGLGVCILRLTRRPQDDPRMSRGLQLLQSKLSILEDLSDRTDSQVQKITSLLEQKVSEVQEKIETADNRIQSLRDAVDQGIETVRLAQSSIRPEEVLEQKSSLKYTQAAKLAFAGHSIEQICADLDMNRAEAEFIVKVNRDSLRTNDVGAPVRPVVPAVAADFSEIFDIPQIETSPTSSLGRLSEEFRKANYEAQQYNQPQTLQQAQKQAGELDFQNSGILIPPTLPTNSERYIEIDSNGVSTYARPLSAPVSAPAATVALASQGNANKPTVEQVMKNSRTNISADRQTTQSRGMTHSRVVNESPVVRKVIFPRIDSKN